MTSSDKYPWPYYADLQHRIEKVSRLGDFYWGLECALAYLLDAIATNTVPANPDDLVTILNRTIASGSRRHRSQTTALNEFALAPQPASTDDIAAETRLEIARIVRLVSSRDVDVLIDAGLGYSDREIAERRDATPGAIRVRLSRLRLKLAA